MCFFTNKEALKWNKLILKEVLWLKSKPIL